MQDGQKILAGKFDDFFRKTWRFLEENLTICIEKFWRFFKENLIVFSKKFDDFYRKM